MTSMRGARSVGLGAGALTVAAALLLAAPAGATDPLPTSETGESAAAIVQDPSNAPAEVTVRVTKVLNHLDRPWDVAFLPDHTMLVTERDRERITARLPGGERRVLADSPAGIWHRSETGLMGIAVDPDFAANRTFYACHGWEDDDGRDIRVTAWEINAGLTEASITRAVVTGIHIDGGKHAGCRLRFGPAGALYVSTGDSRTGPLPQDLGSLNGKILRVDPATGGPWPGNPFQDSDDPNTRLVWTYGHRNPQGLAYRTGEGVKHGMWSAEHGPTRDDEVNRLKAGANYGWNPVPGYNEDAPMTDHSLPGKQTDARWSSGFPTVATSGVTWLAHPRWGAWEGRLAVATLKAQRLLVMRFGPTGEFLGMQTPPELSGTYGDLRVPVVGPHGALYISTDNYDGPDWVLKVVPEPAS